MCKRKKRRRKEFCELFSETIKYQSIEAIIVIDWMLTLLLCLPIPNIIDKTRSFFWVLATTSHSLWHQSWTLIVLALLIEHRNLLFFWLQLWFLKSKLLLVYDLSHWVKSHLKVRLTRDWQHLCDFLGKARGTSREARKDGADWREGRLRVGKRARNF